MPGVNPRSPRGQASAEYVAVLLVVGVVLAGAAATALAVPGVGERLSGAIRTGLCIVGGDVCRNADAVAAGLGPCVTAERSARQDTTLDLAVVRLGGHGEWQLALQSDGGAVVTRLQENEGGGTVGVGLTFSPVRLDAGAQVALTAGYGSGRAWRFADAAEGAAFLERAMHDEAVQDARPPDIRWSGLSHGGEAEVEAAIAGIAVDGPTASAEAVIGLRREGAARTLTVDLGSEGPALAVDLPGFPAAAGVRSALVAEATWQDGAPVELVLRSASARDDRLEEIAVRLDLRDPLNRGLAERLLVPGDTRADLEAIARRAASAGIVERNGYATSERRRGLSLAGRLGVSLGISHERVHSERRLVDAVAWIRGGPPVQRFDCLGV
jgi:hypothetical protein